MKLLRFYAGFCVPCKHLGKLLKETKLTIPISEIDATKEFKLCDDYKVRNVPTTILVDESGKEVKRWVGVFDVANELKEYTEC